MITIIGRDFHVVSFFHNFVAAETLVFCENLFTRIFLRRIVHSLRCFPQIHFRSKIRNSAQKFAEYARKFARKFASAGNPRSHADMMQ